MFWMIIYVVLIGHCYSGIMTYKKSTQYLVEIRNVLPPVSDAEEKNAGAGSVPGNSTATDGLLPVDYTDAERLVPENKTNSDGTVPEENTKKTQSTRHVSRRNLKSLKKKYKQKCKDANTTRCDKLLRQIVQAQSGIDKRSFIRDLLDKFDFRLCLNEGSIVHFHPDTQICCDGVFNKTTGEEECCKGYIIDKREQFCCNGQVKKRTESSECCGVYTYDNRTHTCCNGNLFSKLQGPSCCGDIAYDPEEQTCCFKSYIFNRSLGDSCCGTSVYNSSTHICCGTNIQPIYGRENKKGGCCKGINYYTRCFKCENYAVVPEFNESLQICCDGKIRTRKHGNYTGCCNRQVMHTKTEKCDGGKNIINISNSVSRTVSETTATMIDGKMEYSDVDTAYDSDRTNVIVACGIVLIGAAGAGVVVVCLRRKIRKSRKSEANATKHVFDNNSARQDSYSEQEPFVNVGQRLNNVSYHSSNDHHDDIEVVIPESPEVQFLADDFRLRLMSNDIDKNVSNIMKPDATPNENILTNHYKHSYTQTCPEKESNRRTVFGKPFEYNFILGLSNGTAKMPNSDVKMTLPQSLLRQNQVEVNCTSFRMVAPLRKKLGLSDDETIASPVAEYALTGYGSLKDYAVVVMPFLGSPADLRVGKFHSDEGLNTVVKSIDVPLQGKTNEDVDAFYIIKDSDVYIYTKSFSGFYCTTCRHRPLSLRCFLFGSYKRFTNPLRHEVRIMIYLADDLMKFADYKERMFTNEDAEGRVLKKEMQLRLPTELTETDLIEASIIPTESHYTHWIHKLYPGETTPIYDKVQSVHLEYVAEKCKHCEFCHLQEHDIPYCIEWYLTNKEGVIPNYTFQCIVDVDIIKVSDDTKKSNRIVIDELQLRQEDRYPIEEQFYARTLQGLKEYISGAMTADKRDAVLGTLGSRYSCNGTSVEEVFFKMHEKLTPKYILEAVAAVMKEKHMFTELDVLQACGFLPSNLLSTNVQPVWQDVENAEGQGDGANFEPVPHANASEDNANVVESQGIEHPVEDTCAQAARSVRWNQNPNGNGKESLKSDKNEPVYTLSDRRNVRAELSNPPLTSVSKSMGDLTLTGASGVFDVRGEMTTPAVYSKSNQDSQKLHAQECASLDETNLKNTFQATKSKH